MDKAVVKRTRTRAKEAETRTDLYRVLKGLAILIGALIIGWVALQVLSLALTLVVTLFLYANSKRIFNGERWNRDDSLIFTSDDIKVVAGRNRETLDEKIRFEIPGEKANGVFHAIQAVVLFLYCIIFPSSLSWINILGFASVIVCILETAYHFKSRPTRRPLVEKILRFALVVPAIYIILRIVGWFSII